MSEKNLKKIQDDYWCHASVAPAGRNYLDDISDGVLKIFDVPQEHRTDDAYAYAIRRLIGGELSNEREAYIEKKLIETLLLNDIIDAYKRGEPPEAIDGMKVSYKRFFCPDEDAPPIAYDTSWCV